MYKKSFFAELCYKYIKFLCIVIRPFSEEAVKHACSIVTSWLESNIPKLKKKSGHVGQKLVKSPLLLGDHYDVFISYSHVNSEIAHLIKDHLSTLHTDWKIFIDVADLKTGVVWQTKLYNSIGAYFISCLGNFV